MNDESAHTEPLHIRAIEERDRRGWSQSDAAKAAGMSLRAYQEFESGRSRPQSKNLRGILRAFGFDENVALVPVGPLRVGEFCSTCHRPVFPDDIQPFLNMLGAWLLTLDDGERQELIYQRTREIFETVHNPVDRDAT